MVLDVVVELHCILLDWVGVFGIYEHFLANLRIWEFWGFLRWYSNILRLVIR